MAELEFSDIMQVATYGLPARPIFMDDYSRVDDYERKSRLTTLSKFHVCFLFHVFSGVRVYLKNIILLQKDGKRVV